MDGIRRYEYDIDKIPLYIDDYMEDNKVIKGRKENKEFLVANKKTADRLFYMTIEGQRKLRKDKLEKLNENKLS